MSEKEKESFFDSNVNLFRALLLASVLFLGYLSIKYKMEYVKSETLSVKQIVFEGDTLVLDKLGNLLEIRKCHGKEKIN